MTVLTVANFVTTVADRGALFGLDVGTKTVGIATSDLTRFVATPVITLRRQKFTLDVAELKKLIADRRAVGLVIGLPLNMDGSEGPRAQSTRQFAQNCAGHIDLPITLWDERLSTVAVTKYLIEADASRKKRAEVVDRMAAAYILQGFLDFLRIQPKPSQG